MAAKKATKKPATKRAAKSPKTSAAKPKAAKAKSAARSPERMVAKVSPFNGMPVVDWVRAKTSGWQAHVIARILRLAKSAAPESTASIKWGQPVLDMYGPFAFIKPAKAHVTFGFWRGAELESGKGVLEGDGDRMKHLKITSSDALNDAQISTFVREAVALNRSKGDPTRR